MAQNEGKDQSNKSEYGMGTGTILQTDDIKLLKNKILGMIPNSSLKDISDIIMEESKRLTSSNICYVAYVDQENKDSVGISFSHMTDSCQMFEDMGEARFKIREDGTYGGLLGYSLDTGESFFIHNPANHPAAHGIPEGHEPVSQFLSVPVLYEGDILGQIVLGNPERDYTSEDVDMADSIANIYAIALKMILSDLNYK